MHEGGDVMAPISECCCVENLMLEAMASEAHRDLHAHDLRGFSSQQRLGDIV
jgi:hypothetical protein